MNIAGKAVEPGGKVKGIDTPYVYSIHRYPLLTVTKIGHSHETTVDPLGPTLDFSH